MCTPTTVSPWRVYCSAQRFTWGRVRMQLMQAYVQKSTSTTRPRNCARLSGSELSQRSMPVNSGAAPKSGNDAAGLAGLAGPAAYAKPGAASAAAIDARKARRSEKRE